MNTYVPGVDVAPSDEEKNIITEYLDKILGLLGNLPKQDWFWPIVSALVVAILAYLLWGVIRKHPWVLVGLVIALTLIAVRFLGD